MSYDPIKNPNYVATAIRVENLEPLEGLDNLVALRMFGMQALVSKDVKVGDVGILFSTEVQLSEEFARENSLYRNTDRNKDQTKQGYLEDTRRVKAIKLRGHRSDSLFMPLSSLGYLGHSVPAEVRVGDVFDSINGHEVCRKYILKEPGVNKNASPRVRRVDLKVFPMHIDSENYWRNKHQIPDAAPVVVTQKLHGTSARFGNVPVLRTLKWYEKLAKRIGIPVKETEYQFVVGSRTVVKSIGLTAEEGKVHFYGEADVWTEYADKHSLDALIPEGFIVFGEIVGFTAGGKPIQPKYTYEDAEGSSTLYVYRVATITETGFVNDLSWEQTKQFCRERGLRWVPEFKTMAHGDVNVDDWFMDTRFYYDWSDNDIGSWEDVPIKLSDADTVDEGVCVRYDGPNGIYILKAKSPVFLGHESALLDAGTEDVESSEASE